MIPHNITKDHILQAIQEIDSLEKIPYPRVSVNYDLFYQGKRYPPKYVISIANKYANGSELKSTEFDAIEAKTFLPKLGFEVKLKFEIKFGDVINNQQISTLFSVGNSGGMRKSNKTNTLVLISDQTKNFYKDEWKGDIFHYTGMGLSGDQDINYNQNKTLTESRNNGVEVHLFEVFSPGQYTYQGIVELVDDPYYEMQNDQNGNERKVVIFPLKLIDEMTDPYQHDTTIDHITTKNDGKNEILRKKQVILYGPPGTGKTYGSVIRAHEIIFGYSDPNMTYRLLQQKLMSQSKKEIDYSQLSWADALVLAFEEIGESKKVPVSEIKNTDTIRKVSTYKNSNTISNTIWFFLQKESKMDSLTVNLKNKSGREFFDKDVDSNWFLTDKGHEHLQLLKDDLINSPETSLSQFNFITFHQSFAYEDFIEGIRPELSESSESNISYQIKDGIFKEICKKASLNLNHNFVLIIDEINRGNISKIFGELITLLEDNKRTGEAEEITVKLPYSSQDFSVPSNLYLIGTMNSTDKSIALVDIALRRRFHFERLNVEYDLIGNDTAKLFLRELNSIICAIKNPDYEIGHYYFMNIPEIDEHNNMIRTVFSTKILPLLEEYFFNDWEALATILGPDSINIQKKKKLVWDEDLGKFDGDSDESNQIFGFSLKDASTVFENTMKNFGISRN